MAVVKILLQQMMSIARQQGSAVELCRDVARDVHICLGDIDTVTRSSLHDKFFCFLSDVEYLFLLNTYIVLFFVGCGS